MLGKKKTTLASASRNLTSSPSSQGAGNGRYPPKIGYLTEKTVIFSMIFFVGFPNDKPSWKKRMDLWAVGCHQVNVDAGASGLTCLTFDGELIYDIFSSLWMKSTGDYLTMG